MPGKGLLSNLISKTFKQCGIGLPVDGSANQHVKIKGLPKQASSGGKIINQRRMR